MKIRKFNGFLKRFTAITLSFVLAVPVSPISVFADQNNEENVNGIEYVEKTDEAASTNEESVGVSESVDSSKEKTDNKKEGTVEIVEDEKTDAEKSEETEAPGSEIKANESDIDSSEKDIDVNDDESGLTEENKKDQVVEPTDSEDEKSEAQKAESASKRSLRTINAKNTSSDDDDEEEKIEDLTPNYRTATPSNMSNDEEVPDDVPPEDFEDNFLDIQRVGGVDKINWSASSNGDGNLYIEFDILATNMGISSGYDTIHVSVGNDQTFYGPILSYGSSVAAPPSTNSNYGTLTPYDYSCVIGEYPYERTTKLSGKITVNQTQLANWTRNGTVHATIGSFTDGNYSYWNSDVTISNWASAVAGMTGFTVAYNANGGSSTPATQTGATTITLPSSAGNKTGYSLIGWGVNQGNTANAGAPGASYTATSNVTLYAVWKANNYTLTYNANGGTVSPASKSITYNSAYGALATPSRTGYSFNGWFTAATGGTQVSASTIHSSASNVTIYAHWTANTYTVTYNANGGEVNPSTKNVTYDAAYGTLPSPTRTGYRFAGWFTAQTGGTQVTASTIYKTAGNSIIYAHWNANTYTIKFDPDEANNTGITGSIADKAMTYDIAADLPENTFRRIGYHFMGWATQSGGNVVYQDKENVKNLTAVHGDTVTLYAVFEINEYDVVYHSVAKGESGDATTKETYTYGQNYTLLKYSKEIQGGTPKDDDQLPAVAKFGYDLKNWTVEGADEVTELNNGASVINLTETHIGTVDLYPVWEANQYVIHFDADGGQLPAGSASQKTVTFDQPIGELPTPEHQDKTFLGWRLNAALVDEATVYKNNTDNFISAMWKFEYTVDENTNTYITKSGKHFTIGEDGVVNTVDDRRVYPGKDNAYGTEDDFYYTLDDSMQGNKVFAGADKKFDSSGDYDESGDDWYWVDKEQGLYKTAGQDGSIEQDADNVLYHENCGHAEAGYHDDSDPLVNPGKDNVFGTLDDWYEIDDEKSMRPGPDNKFNTADDMALVIGNDEAFATADDYLPISNTNLYRMAGEDTYVDEDSVNVADTSDDTIWWIGFDKDDNTIDDRKIEPGDDGLYGTEDDYNIYGLPPYETAKHFPGEDAIFGTNDDYLLLENGTKIKIGEDGTLGSVDDYVELPDGSRHYPGPDTIFDTDDDRWQTPEEIDKGENHDKDGNRYLNGDDGIPGTDDDIPIHKDENGNEYIDGTGNEEGNRHYPGEDGRYGTDDDRWKTDDEVGSGTNHDKDGLVYFDGEDTVPGTSDDKPVILNHDFEASNYTDNDGHQVYPGPDKKFGTPDDRKDLGNGTNVERGDHQDHADDFGGGAAKEYQNDKHYTNSDDGIPGSTDDFDLNAGIDNKFGTKDDNYVGEGGKDIYPGPDKAFGTNDDRKDLENGTNVERGAVKESYFGDENNHYTNAEDEIPGTEDDKLINAGADNAYGTADDNYRDSDAKDVYPGPDCEFATPDDRKDIGNGINVERGNNDDPSADFGGGIDNGYQTTTWYITGPDAIPGTNDDSEINPGADNILGTIDDFYFDANEKVYVGPDFIFNTADDRKDIGDGRNVERGDGTNEPFSVKNSHYVNGADEVPGSADDKPINPGKDRTYRTDNDFFIDNDGDSIYPGPDNRFYTSDDRKDLEDGTNVERGNGTAEFAPANNHYTNEEDEVPGTRDDKLINAGADNTYGTADDNYDDGNGQKIYPGPDGKFDTADDRKDLGDGTNVERGSDGDEFAVDDKHYTNGEDGVPGTNDDKLIKPGIDGVYGTPDDHYTDVDGKDIYPGPDGRFETEDDRKNNGDGTNTERGPNQDDPFNKDNNDTYTNGNDKIPGTTDDALINKGAYNNYYTDEDNKNVYPGPDGIFGTPDDRKDLGNGTNVERGDHQDPADDFGGGAANDYQNDKHYTNANDTIPGTNDDKEINAGNDGVYGTGDDSFNDSDEHDVYPGPDYEFGTPDDRKDIGSGVNVERGNHASHNDDFGGGKDNDYQSDKHYVTGEDVIPGTNDDIEINPGSDNVYMNSDDYIPDESGKNCYPGPDKVFITPDDRLDLGNGTNVERGQHDNQSDEFGGREAANYQNDNHYTNDKDKIPGTEDDKLINAGNDGVYGTADDFYIDPEDGKKVYPGEDLIFGTADDRKDNGDGTNTERGADSENEFDKGDNDEYTNGEDITPGTEDDEPIDKKDGIKHYTDTDGKEVYPGPDGVFGTPDDRKDLGNGTNVERGDHDNPADDFGGGKDNNYQNDDHYTNGADKIPGTADDKKINPGKDNEYGTQDDNYDNGNGGKVYPGNDNKFGTEDDRVDNGDGTNSAADENGNPTGDIKTNGEDVIPGTGDDKPVIVNPNNPADSHYTDDDGRNVYPGPDGKFGTEDDRKDIGDNKNVERGNHDNPNDEFGGGEANGFSGDTQYYSGDDKIPGTSDDKVIKTDEKGNEYIEESNGDRHYPGLDKKYDTPDDRWQTPEEVAAGRNHDKDGNVYSNGPDGIPGSADDFRYGNSRRGSSSGSSGSSVSTRSVGTGNRYSHLDGTWSKNANGEWMFTTNSGNVLRGWAQIEINDGTQMVYKWYHFNNNGFMDHGWFNDADGKWYYLTEEQNQLFGSMVQGWHHDSQDGKYYYLSIDGSMVTGWSEISGKWYYFTSYVPEITWTQDATGRWIYAKTGARSFGSLYMNDVTPDGFTVDATGARQ